ncbi:LysR family transcriptional regulator [Alphaproteobacteria bacterium GH1-50]|uniref:LysR family transcriptional regulator n=1 Tax=Kangsaoukella pontilimi TaxID=2691042 RepID=A0A7C9MFR2_9RHOB|nr:LysR family transcriptional regulator [Kangsaoukella pontilimi]
MALHVLPRALNYLETVARLGSIQAASRSLGIAASAIDRQIIALEEGCQTPLFERHARGMRLTSAGEAAVLLARRWRADEERLEETIRTMRGEQFGTVRLGAMDSLVNSILPDLVSTFAERYPRIRFSVDILTPQDAAHELEIGSIDLALAFNLPDDRSRHVLWSAPLPFGCVVGRGHSLWDCPRTTLGEAAKHPLAAQSRVLPVREYLDKRFGWLFDPAEPALVTNSLQFMKQMLVGGKYLAITSQLDALSELENGTLRFVPITDQNLRPQSISVAVDARRPLSRAARLVGEALADTLSTRLEAI